MSKTYGAKKTEILEDENSSQTSQAGFDNDLVKKNRIEEIRANLFNNITNFFTLKYVKMTIILIMSFTLVFSIAYLFLFLNINSELESITLVNLDLFQTTLWTTELVSIFISLKMLLMEKNDIINDIDFLNYQSDDIITNDDYYNEMEKIAHILYLNLSKHCGKLDMDIPKYLNEYELLSLYWDHFNVSYVNDKYSRDGWILNESFPTSIDQFLCNCINFLKYNYSVQYSSLEKKDENFEEIFNYTSYLIIENAYNNIIPNQFLKLNTIPNIFSKTNESKKVVVIVLISISSGLIIILCFIYFVMIRTTNKSMTDGFKKITKIKIEKIEERIKK